MIKVISFDIGGTLLHTNSIDEYNLKKLTQIVGKQYDAVRYAYKTIFQKQKGTLEELVSKFTNLLEVEQNSNISDFFKEKFSEKNNISIIDANAQKLFKTLKNKGYKIILFSNSCCLLKNDFSESLLKYIDKIFYSYDIGYTKSDEESFKIVEKEMNVLGSEILHIGDTLKSDYINPIKYGWNALYYGKTDNRDIKTISELNEIVKNVL